MPSIFRIIQTHISQAKVPKEKKIAVIKAIRAITGHASHAKPSFRLLDVSVLDDKMLLKIVQYAEHILDICR